MNLIKLTMTADLAQRVFNLLGEIAAKHAASTLLEFAQAAKDAEEVAPPQVTPEPPAQATNDVHLMEAKPDGD